MQGTIDPKRLDRVTNWSLKHGSHDANDDGNLCAMDLVRRMIEVQYVTWPGKALGLA